MSPTSEDMKKNWSITGVSVPAGVLTGMGVGFLIHNVPAGLFIGLGCGFLLMMIGMMILQFRK